MSELFDKSMNTKMRKLSGFMQIAASPQKGCDENERKKQRNYKNDTYLNVFVGRR